MSEKHGAAAWFAGKGFAPRELFSHLAVALPKPYPDAQLLLERRGFAQQELEQGRFYQLNLYTTDFWNFPDALFIDPEINWHAQQFGRKGLVASAGLWSCGSSATISTLQSDLCQQLCHHNVWRDLWKTQVETHFKYWYALLLNAVMDFCIDLNISNLYSPTGRQIIANTAKAVRPDLFLRIYDYVHTAYQCHEVSVGSAQYWRVPIAENLNRIVPLAPTHQPSSQTAAPTKICILHDIEENVDTDVSKSECAKTLHRMLEVERASGVSTTYNILGRLLKQKRDEVIASDSRHSIGFHSFNHNIDDLTQLELCREVDLRVKGYRPPQSKITAELSDYRLTMLNFEWVASSAQTLSFDDCRLQNGIVKIPIRLDDYPLFLGQPYEEWEAALLHVTRSAPFCAFGLHDCYAEKWLPSYKALICKLGAIGQFVTADDICADLLLGNKCPALQ